tara:strand:- start:4639 stop:4998 length:360 start_codon:yes stop_codon:yes gene_type:complete
MKIGIQKIETFSVTQTTKEFVFEMDEFRNCTPAFIGKNHNEFMDYITNDIEDMKSFLDDNMDVISKETYRKLYLLEIDPVYDVIEDSRNQYEDSWFTMNKNVDVKEKVLTNAKTKVIND